MDILRALFGILFLIGLGYLFSNNKKAIDWKIVGIGIALQIIFGLLIAEVEIVTKLFRGVSYAFVKFLDFAGEGAFFLFGGLARNSFEDSSAGHQLGFIFAFQVLPTIIFFSAVSSGLYYLGVLQKIVYGIAWVMSKTMRLSGAESLSAAGNIFLGQTEAPLLVRPFIKNMTQSELMCLMTGGMATIAGAVLAAYVKLLGGDSIEAQTQYASYLLSASFMNAPAAIVMSKIFVPESNPEAIDTELKVNKENIGVNLIDALSQGTSVGLKLAANVGAMLLAFIAIIYALNGLLVGFIGDYTGLNQYVIESTNGSFDGFSLQYILGQIFRVFAWVIGVPWQDTLQVGSLLGQKTVINEFIAYDNLAKGLKGDNPLTGKSLIIATYVLCGFSNFSSIAIQVGGIGSLAPNQQGNLSKLGFKALFAATIACMLTATIAGALIKA
ncbi:NupC/NupG family nucleoside CNT transporter [Marinigracilibium pacificum]|uniref:NupC/NupG family nucleoside CNT transporter n=1 Tax=Marinigracilibium pacificum TaxID=2729599 RepID=A0A848J0T7_9BACT|nr:nucleoside transporter C-terminal domain-containing protein [Marinigracilibium pacificum]NMM48094.1 NupC/NupG family nucleoside CNT transporter [Marinigracilibium pacificum]